MLPTGISPPAARRWLTTSSSLHGVLPAFEVFFSRSPLRRRSVTRSPLGCSPRLRGAVSPGWPCLSARLRSWPFFLRVSVREHGGSQAGPSASPTRTDVPDALALGTAALAFAACLRCGLGCPMCRFWRRPGVRSSDASRPVFLRAALQGVPRLLPALASQRGRPSRCFSHPQGLKFSRRPLRH